MVDGPTSKTVLQLKIPIGPCKDPAVSACPVFWVMYRETLKVEAIAQCTRFYRAPTNVFCSCLAETILFLLRKFAPPENSIRIMPAKKGDEWYTDWVVTTDLWVNLLPSSRGSKQEVLCRLDNLLRHQGSEFEYSEGLSIGSGKRHFTSRKRGGARQRYRKESQKENAVGIEEERRRKRGTLARAVNSRGRSRNAHARTEPRDGPGVIQRLVARECILNTSWNGTDEIETKRAHSFHAIRADGRASSSWQEARKHTKGAEEKGIDFAARHRSAET
ncbi:hypothetical protein KM043_012402 [Ampulex compressa]|nr:hypothetical protein KM043_012402 [Ampulex compressa]